MHSSLQRKRMWFEWAVVPAGLCLVALSGLWWNYLVFHTLAETISIVVGLMAMTVALAAFPRPYRPALSIESALAEIERGRGTIYDADVADACLRPMRKPGYALPA